MIRQQLAWWLGSALAVALSAASASAADKLTVQGVVLSRVQVPNLAAAAISRTIEIDAGEVVAATYVSLRTADGKYLQRNNDGYWLTWSGSRDALLDNYFQPVGNQLTFKVLKQDISQQSFPLTVSISYRSAAGVKFGVFEVMPQ
jgi:hypothetical protein